MLFTQPIFLVFFIAVFCCYWATPWYRIRKPILLVASYIFYAGWDWRFLFLIAASTVIDYIVGLVLRQDNPRGGRRFWLIISLCANLGILGFFKYFNFFVTSAQGLLSLMGLEIGDRTLTIILPVGISFFTFQTMSYTIDVYRKKIEPITHFADFALFVSFFPQLVAGPIVRAKDFLPQLVTKRKLKDVNFRWALSLFLVGFIKKACVADNLAPVVDQVFANPEIYTVFSIWIAVLFYIIQVYCDFSGYTDMAIAVAGMLGFKLRLNFNFPYFASNIQELWNRWHISLSSWLRDYIYIPLGGNRGSLLFTYRNLMLTMLLGGLWHGASWNYVIWGGLHGLGLIIHREYDKQAGAFKPLASVFKVLGPFMTIYWFCLTIIVFRAPSLTDSLTMCKSFVLFNSSGTRAMPVEYLYAFIALALIHWVSYKKYLSRPLEALPDWAYAFAYGCIAAIIISFVPMDYRPFIYFQF